MPPPVIEPSQTAPGAIAPSAGRAAIRRRPAVKPTFNLINFARQTLKQPTSTGAIAPSSRFVANSVIAHANLDAAQSVVELGPGTGVFTEQIEKQLRGEATFFALELNPAFVRATRNRCPYTTVYHDSAHNIERYLNRHNLSQCDCIISSLPWTIFDPAEQDRLLRILSEVLAPGGRFVSIVYLGAKVRARGRYFIDSLPTHFNTIYKTKTVWQNLPPTQIYRCGN